MGLPEKRAIKEFQEKQFPKLKEELDAAASFSVPLEVDWGTLAPDGFADVLADALPKVFFNPLTEVVKSICEDELGKEALQGALKNVVIKSSGSKKIAFENGVLTFDHGPTTNIDYGKERVAELQKKLEAGL